MRRGTFHGHLRHIRVHHYLHQLLKRSLSRIPPQLTSRFRWISPKINHIGGTIEIGRYLHQHLSLLAVDSILIFLLTLPVQFKAHITESQFAKLPYGMLLTRSDHEVLRFLILKDQPHTFHIILGIPPITKRR